MSGSTIQPRLAPIAKADRIEALDILRGFAVQMGRAEASGRDFGTFYARRLLILLGIGALHHALAWEGDILKLYALLGFVLLLFRKARDRSLLLAAATVWILGTAGGVIAESVKGDPSGSGLAWYLAAARAAFGGGTYLEAFLFRLGNLPLVTGVLAVAQGGIALAMFLLGLYAGRRGLLSRLGELRLLPHGVLASGLLGAALTILVLSLPAGVARLVVEALANGAMTAFYAGGILLLARSPRRARWLAPLAAGGRMALTNYVLQSFLASFVFHGHGLGLYERVGPAGCLAFALLTYALQLAGSSWWLSRFKYGPLEWAWRSLTYGRAQPFRAAA